MASRALQALGDFGVVQVNAGLDGWV